MNTYAFTVRHRNGWGSGFGPRPTHCHQCGADLPSPNLPGHSAGTGYGCGPAEPIASHPDAPALRKGESLGRAPAICYSCCAANERARMIETGRAVLYLSRRGFGEPAGSLHYSPRTEWTISDWAGRLSFPVSLIRSSRRGGGFGADRLDVWFVGPDGFMWHAVNRGDNNIARCRRTKQRAPA